MKELLKFDYLDTKLGVLIENSKLIYVKYLDDYTVTYKVSKEEKEIIKKILCDLLPSNNIYDLGNIKYLNEDIKHLFDYDKKFHIFCNQDNKVTNNCIYLNYIFNNQEEYINLAILKNNDYMERSNSRYVKRKVKIKNRVITVTVLAAFLLSLSVAAYKSKFKIDEPNIEYIPTATVEALENDSSFIKRTPAVQEIENAILNNKNLSKDEKEVFLSNYDFFYENAEYFDYDSVISNLNSLDVQYIDSSAATEGMYGDFTRTGPDTGRIRIYNCKNFKEAERYALTHEFLHAFTTNDNPYYYFYEGFHVIFNNEYFSNTSDPIYDNGYNSIRNYIYLLCELIDEDVLRQFHADDNMEYLVDELVKIIPDREKAIKLLTNIDKIVRFEIAGADINVIRSIHQETKSIFKEYYQAKYQIDNIEDDNYIFFLFNPENCYTKIASELNLDIETFKLADEYGKVKQYKKIFNKDGNDDLIISIPCTSKMVPKNYTLEELLNGKAPRVFPNKESITLEMNKDGTYVDYVYEPVDYIDVCIKFNPKENIKR